MAAPSYTEDLTDITLSQATTGFSAYGGGGAGLGTGADFAMQGTLCVDKQVSNAEKGMLYDNGSGITMGTGDHVYVWIFTATPGITDTLVNRGVVVGIGSSTSNFCKYHVEGNETFGAQGRVARCYPIDQTVDTDNTSSVPFRTRVGTPSGSLEFFGGGLNTTASSKAVNIGIDAMRYGTGAYITAGDSGDPATFAGFVEQNDLLANRWGILTDVGGSYELQGIFAIGQNNAGTATLAYFSDADRNIVLVDTVHSATDFTQFIIDHASTEVYWDNIKITALGTNNPGEITINNSSSIVEFDTCQFTSIGTTALEGGATVTNTVWDLSDQITLNGATITDGRISNSSNTSALLVDTALEMADVTGVSFIDNNSSLATAYFDGSDVAATDQGSAWSNVTNSDDGDTATVATTGGTVSTLKIEGTSYSPTGTPEITQVRVRAYAHMVGIAPAPITSVLEDGASSLGSFVVQTLVSSATWGEWTTLSVPSGGWTVAKVQGLECNMGGGGTISSSSLGVVELEITEKRGHSVELTATGTHEFDGITFSGGGGTPGSNLVASSGSTFADVYNNSGGEITINITGGTTPSVRNAVDSTTIVVVNPVTTLITVRDINTGLPVENARVKLEVSDGTNFPYQDTVTLTSSGTTATCTHTAHGLATNDFITIRNANEERYNGCFDITVTDANTYTYTMTASTTSPATGTIDATFSYFNSLTNASGVVTDTRSISVDQAVTGKVRKGSTSPLYQQSPISETVDKDNGLTLNIQLIPDE